MLNLAVRAGIPIIAVTTTDTLNLTAVLKHVTGRAPVKYGATAVGMNKKQLYYQVLNGQDVNSLEKVYEAMVKAESTLVLVNPKKVHPLMFNAGEVPVPRDMMYKMLVDSFEDEALAKSLLPTLGGCTIKDAVEFARLTMARDKSLTAAGMMTTRKACFSGSQGVSLVDTTEVHYEPPAGLQLWVAREMPFFLYENDPRLMPRGLLCDGIPGTGKTMAAKYIARQWGVPLYRVDVGAAKQKYVGESEANMARALNQLDHEQPCVALFDEIEKVFGADGYHDSGTTTSMLSQLLWWLAERRSRVLVVMTCNNRGVLPPELYRDGRIDEVMVFRGLRSPEEATEFAAFVLKSFPGVKVDNHELAEAIGHAWTFKARHIGDEKELAQATVTKVVTEVVKKSMYGSENN